MNTEWMSYADLLDRGKKARIRGNEELAKALFERAKEEKNNINKTKADK
ncbi:hypothetical protein [Prochlorococcus sp. MIT 1307]|nr:hypothetical protein [Prochlorococcus sp. MIT 1307]